jgi:hypothetical protein
MEGSPQKNDGYYKAMNVQPRQSITLHSHFVELYSALKLGIQCLSVKSDSPKCPDEIKDDDDFVDVFMEALLNCCFLILKSFNLGSGGAFLW